MSYQWWTLSRKQKIYIVPLRRQGVDDIAASCDKFYEYVQQFGSMWVWGRLGSVNQGTGTYESWMLNAGQTVVQLHAAKQATTEIQCRGCVCPSSPLQCCCPQSVKHCKALPVAQFLGAAGCWILQIWCPVGEVAEWVNPECSSLHKLCWSVPPSQLIWSLPAKSLFGFDLYLWLCPYHAFWSGIRLYSL